jgi:hypothetical protein
MWQDPIIRYILLIGLILVTSLVYVVRSNGKNKNTIRFNAGIVAGFDQWLYSNMGYFMTKFLNEKLGKELLKETELNMGAVLALDGINYVCQNIYMSIPDFYIDYMTKFYGPDKLFVHIRERTRDAFIKFIENTIKQRVSGGSLIGVNNQNNTATTNQNQ